MCTSYIRHIDEIAIATTVCTSYIRHIVEIPIATTLCTSYIRHNDEIAIATTVFTNYIKLICWCVAPFRFTSCCHESPSSLQPSSSTPTRLPVVRRKCPPPTRAGVRARTATICCHLAEPKRTSRTVSNAHTQLSVVYANYLSLNPFFKFKKKKNN